MTYDILIQNGTIIDGSGKPRFQGDVGVSNGLIRAVSDSPMQGAEAEKVIDAAGKFVVPGFIDITSQADKNWSLFENPNQDYLLTQGVTTIVIGNCGVSLAPIAHESAITLLRKWMRGSEANINWISLGEFLDELTKHNPGVNVATLVGHGTIRRGILKGEARALLPEELTRCEALIVRAMKEGAFGFSTGLVYSHESPATLDELTYLAKATANAGGVYKTHLRSEGKDLIPALNEAIQIGRESGVRVIISHLKAVGKKAWPSFSKALGMIERANSEKNRFTFDISPYRRTGSFLYLILPKWAREGGFSGMLDRIAKPDTRAKLIDELKTSQIRFERYIIANAEASNLNGKTIAEVARTSGVGPEETILDLLSASHGRIIIFGKATAEYNLEAGVRHSMGVVASDGTGISEALVQSGALVHPRSSGAFPHFLHRFVKERSLLTWEEGIRKITATPASLLGIAKRGLIENGFFADITIINSETIRDRSTYHNPFVHPEGVETVIVNGKVAAEQGRSTGISAGMVLRKS